MNIINWHIFELKFNQRETSAFEDLAYLLFCAEFDNRIGIFRYKNQTGIETEPIVNEKTTYGFQAKYYTTPFSSNKTDIIDSIRKAKIKNTQLDKLFFYINKEASESSKSNQKKPQYLIDIEKEAGKIGLILEWRVPSHLEKQLILPENKYIYDLFFNLDPGTGDLLDEVTLHNRNILQSIQTEITCDDKSIKIDRTVIIDQIRHCIENKKHLVISGEGGCGKTAVIKEFYHKYAYPVCFFKATELNVSHINDLFRFDHNFSIGQFIEAYDTEQQKVFIVDSAEKLAELNNSDILHNLIKTLVENNWIIIFTTRHSYLDDLKFHIKQTYQIPCEDININVLDDTKLQLLSEEFDFTLPQNFKFKERLKNLFYLNEYIREYHQIDKNGKTRNFINLIWKKRIQNNSYQKDSIHIEREKSFIEIAKERCKTGLFYISASNLSQKALSLLVQDEILGYDEPHGGYFITHDIYEEWALDKIVNRCFVNYIDTKSFFEELGDSLPIRRAFRVWLSEQLSDDLESIESFISDIFTDKDIPLYWKDELLISILLSDYSSSFFSHFENNIIDNDFIILNRILFLLRIACNEISSIEKAESTELFYTRPKGKGWEIVIAFIYKHREEYFEKNLKLILPILTEIVNINKEGETIRYAGLLALSLIEKEIITDGFYIHRDTEETIYKIIYNSSQGIKSELHEIFESVITNKWTYNDDPYSEFCEKILKKPYYAVETIKIFPNYVIQLCDLFWRKQETEEDGLHRIGVEERYGLTNEFHSDYYPASAFQTPIYLLLQVSFKATLGFIIDFTNRVVDYLVNTKPSQEDIEEIVLYIEEKEVRQYLSPNLWGIYRGMGSSPDILQSIHMALEKILLEYVQFLEISIIEQILVDILQRSKSASLTAIVCSIVLANPEKFHRIALILFKTIEFFHVDSTRKMNESHIFTPFMPNKEFYGKERITSKQLEHRSICVESQFVNYQFLGIRGKTEEENNSYITALYDIIDQHKADLLSKATGEQTSLEILLARMDRRKMRPEIKKQSSLDYIIELNPQLTPELKSHSDLAEKEFSDIFKYTSIKMWGIFKCTGNDKVANYPQYESNPLNALSELRNFINEVNSGTRQVLPTDDYIPYFVCSALVRFYDSHLNKDDLLYCKEIIIERVNDILIDNYAYQIQDGAEASIHAIPSLMRLFPEDIPHFLRMLLFVLFDSSKISEYKRICDYAIETIQQERVWEIAYHDANLLLKFYILSKPIFNDLFIKLQKGEIQGSKQEILSIVEEKIETIDFNDITINSSDIGDLPIEDLEIIFNLIPNNTQDKQLLSIVTSLIPYISELLIKKERYDHLFSLRIKVFRKFSHFILHRNTDEITDYIIPFLKKFGGNEESKWFISELVSAEDIYCRTEQFWYIWNALYDYIIKIEPKSYYTKDVIIEYLLAWQFWPNDIEEWHSLKKENLSIYKRISTDIGSHSAVLYSITKVLNSIGRKYTEDGIDWIYTIITKNNSLVLGDLESNTIIYLERLIRRFVFYNKERIKKELRIKNKIITILNFIIEKGSVHGYLLRESVL